MTSDSFLGDFIRTLRIVIGAAELKPLIALSHGIAISGEFPH